MQRLTALMLAGALSWPAVSYAQGPFGGPGRPPVPPAAPSAGVSGPGVPALPPGLAMAQAPKAEELPAPGSAETPGATPAPGGAKPVGPEVGGYHFAKTMGFPPGVAAPVAPPPCPPAPPVPDCGPDDGGWITFGDLLWIRAGRRDPVTYQQFSTGNVTFVSQNGSDTDHILSYRAGGGYLTPNGWVFLASYTQVKDLVSDLLYPHDGSSDYVIGYTGPGQLLSQTLETTGVLYTSWNLQFRTLDVFAGAAYSPTEFIDLLVGGGARFAWIDQQYNTIIDSRPSDGPVSAENLRLDMRGAGPRFGSEARVYLAPWWSLYGRGFTSLLLSHRKDQSFLVESDAGGDVQFINVVTYEREEVLPVLELAVGTEFATFHGQLLVGFGYEMQYFWQLNTSAVDALAQPRLSNHNDLSLDGFYARVMMLW